MTTHIKSGWKDPIGKPLTNARIRHYERLGYYGEAREAAVESYSGIIHRCVECNTKKHVVFRRFRYLPSSGFYCPSCVEKYRAVLIAAQQEKEKWHTILKQEYV